GEPGGRVVGVAGRGCMDQLVLDLGPDATERAGDVVTLFGAGDGVARGGVPTAEDWAQAAGTISYEITTRLGARVPRDHVGTHVLDHGARALLARDPSPHDSTERTVRA
ncbi:alanine racemase C-terminal domain-containing protein, partial [Cellulosimicrobium funkei]|uniref:alanine racemase C-terminal domain-containing protein n=1 Tax=Cellulosimicrobium funkei TaxID=264251 RepID=UPI003756A9FD